MTVFGALRRARYRVHFALAALVGGLAFLALSMVGLLYVALTRDRRSPVFFTQVFSAFMRSFLGWRIEVENPVSLTLDHPVVMMVRHQSNLDVMTVGMVYPYRTVVLGKMEIRKIPLFGWFFAATGNIFVDRKNPRKAIESLREAAERVKTEKLSVWVFPEGTRNPSRSLRPFKKGAFHLAIAAQLPILPVACGPLDTLFAGKRFFVRPGRLTIRILPEVPTAGLTEADVDLLVDRVWKSMDEGQRLLVERAGVPVG